MKAFDIIKKAISRLVYPEGLTCAVCESELDEKQQETILKLVDKLEELDDVQNVYHNAVITIADEEE